MSTTLDLVLRTQARDHIRAICCALNVSCLPPAAVMDAAVVALRAGEPERVPDLVWEWYERWWGRRR